LHPHHLLIEEKDGIKGLILRAGGNTVLGKAGEKPFQFLFAGRMSRKSFEKVAISPDPGAIAPLGGGCKVVALKHSRQSGKGFVLVHNSMLMYEQHVEY
jgi:hypothetical protein